MITREAQKLGEASDNGGIKTGFIGKINHIKQVSINEESKTPTGLNDDGFQRSSSKLE